jgi:hypothetical protein
MGSPLDYISTEGFRKKLIVRNLVPYAKSPSPATPPITFEVIQRDLTPVDSPDFLIDTTFFADKQYTLNRWGSLGGYYQAPALSNNLNTTSNQGEYGPGQQDAHIVDTGFAATQKWRPLNAYSTNNNFDAGEAVTSLEIVTPDQDRPPNGQPYPRFNPSSYPPVSILLNPDPQGSNGLLSDDSFIARLGAKTLKKEFQDRIGRELIRQTVGRANILNVNSGTNLVNILTGRVPLIEPNYNITVPSNPLGAAANFALSLAGSSAPFSLIPGSYFDTSINPPQPTTIQQSLLANPIAAAGNFISNLLGANKTGTQIFYENTGQGQKSILFKNINYNKFKPNYDRTLIDRLGGAIVGTNTNNSNFYVGSTSSDPSRVFSPSGALPSDAFGNEQQDPVYGPSELAELYEGPSKEIRLGANGPTYSNGGGIEGGFTWVSPKYKGNAGKKVGPGGAIYDQDQDFKPSSYNSTESTERTFKEGSILDKTQRIIDSQPQGGKRLQHVGNAMDQVSKVFNDGYKEMTKGSRVLTYVGEIGQEVGTEYCRVFAKDIPYLQYNDLQKTNGITTEGRRFSYSVLDKTYNLNIAPNKQEGGQDSSNIIGTMNDAYAKKYMFSLENLAWATSNSPGLAVSDLAVCERGPNGGRVMWFPPYNLVFGEAVQANWNPTDFIGRPEPIYTYKNTSRTGSLTWDIVVDHPSILNVIVNKVLANETNKTRVDSILDSFFAGCRKYDLYELAKKYYTINPNDLFQIQQAITSKEITREQMQYAVSTITVDAQVAGENGAGNGSTGANSSSTPASGSPEYFAKYNQIGFYFGNDFPKRNTSPNYTEEYNRYTSATNKGIYASKSNGAQLTQAFDTMVTPNYVIANKMAVDIAEQIKNSESGTVTLIVDSSCSAPQTEAYNLALSTRRIDSVIKFFAENLSTKDYVKQQRLIVKRGQGFGETTRSAPLVSKNNQPPYELPFSSNPSVNCTDTNGTAVGGDTMAATEIFTTNAMSCRRAYISKIESTLKSPPPAPPNPIKQTQTVVTGNVVTTTEKVNTTETVVVQRDNISKRVLRALLSECDYFEVIKEETPMVFDNLKDKLKFFEPAFHSMTPEGLNTRLTFLQQCMRPGDTIPVVKSIGGKDVLEYNNATNTAFGAPPVLILRVGDFFHTKVIPTSLSIAYEGLDINPEGIGVQPMIAKVTMAFNFVGGSGLKESVDKLQNALTFNYYANTEIYDDRADPTDSSYKVIDKDFLQFLATSNVPPPTINDAQPNNGLSNESTIGTIGTNSITETGQTGTISYQTFMDKFVAETQNYFTNVINKNKETVNQYNNALRQQWMLERNYEQGKFLLNENTDTILFGKPYNTEKRIDNIFNDLIKDVKQGDEGFIQFIDNSEKNFSNKVIRQVKENYIKILNDKKGTYQNAVTTITQSMVNVQQTYVGYIARANTITYYVPSFSETGTDGSQQKNGNVTSFITIPTTNIDTSSQGVTNTLEELSNDIVKINSGITEFNKITTTPTLFVSPTYGGYNGVYLVFPPNYKFPEGVKIFVPMSKNQSYITLSPSATFENTTFKMVYMIVSNDVVDLKKYETFKNAMIGNIINNEGLIAGGWDGTKLTEQFDAYWDKIAKPLFVEENNITKEFIESQEKEKLQPFLKYTPFPTKKREFTYTTENAGTKPQQTLIKGLGSTENYNTNNKTWNDEISADVYVSKVKFN